MTTLNDQNATLPAHATTVIEKENRDSLIEKFDDLKTPSGNDFEALIRSSFNQVDDPIQVVKVDDKSELEVSAPLTITSDTQTNEKLKLSANELSMTQGETQTLNLDSDSMEMFDGVLSLSKDDKKLQVSGTVQASMLNATAQVNTVQLNTDALLVNNASTEILRAELDENTAPKVTISGDAKITKSVTAQSLNVTDTIDASDLVVSVSSTLANASANTLVVTGKTILSDKLEGENAIFTRHLEVSDTLGVGIDAQSTQAKLHISKRSSDMDALLRVDDYNNDTTPFFINSEGKVGVGTTDVAADFHVASDALFGDIRNAHYVKLNGLDKSHFEGNVSVSESMSVGVNELPIDAGSLAVSGKLALGKVNATAKLDVNGNTGESLLNIATNAAQFVKVTDAPLLDESKITVYQATKIKDALSVEGHVTGESVTVNQHLDSDTATINGQLIAGSTTTDSLTVNTHADIEQAQIYNQLNIASNNDQLNWECDAKLAVLSSPSNPSGVEISHFNGQAVTPIITSKMDKLGLFESNPMKSLHVGADALFAHSVDFASDINVLNNNDEAIFSVNDMNVVVGNSNFSTQLSVHGGAGIFGNTEVHGQLTVGVAGNPLLRTANSQVHITQLSEQAAIKVEHATEGFATYMAAGQLAINQPLPVSDVNFALTGQACVTGQVQIMGEANSGEEVALEVQGDTKLKNKLCVNGTAQVDDGLSLSVTNNSAQQQKDALAVQGSSHLAGTLSVTDAVDFHNGLTVTDGDVTFSDNFNANGPTTVDNTLTVNGHVSVMDGMKISPTESGNALLVEGGAQFDTDVEIEGDLNLSDKPANARLHIQEQGKQGLYIERQGGQAGLVFNDGRLGVGVERPDYALDVAEDSQFRKDVGIKGRLEVDESLHVDEYASFRSNINVYGNSELAGEARFGLPFSSVIDDESAGMPAGIAQVAIDQNHFAKAFAVYHQGAKPVVIEGGKLGVQTDSPTQALDVNGNAVFRGDVELKGTLHGSGRLECLDGAKIFGDVELRSDLTVSDDVHLKDTLLVDGISTFNRHVEVKSESTFQGSVRLNDELSVQNHTSLRDTLTVAKQATFQGGINIEGLEVGSQVSVTPAATFNNAVTVHGQVNLLSTLQMGSRITGPSMSVFGTEGEHLINVESGKDAAPLMIQANGHDALHITSEGNVGIGTQTPSHKLDIEGDVRVRNALLVDNSLSFADGAIIQSDCTVNGSLNSSTLQLGETQMIDCISADVDLGGDMASDEALATQAAVKAYIDAHCWSWAKSNKVLLIQNQQEFDEVMSRELLCNVTLLLLPHTSHPQMNRVYKLKQQVRIGSNVSIIGFNERETRIVKEHAGCRFLIHGQSDALIKSVEMRGFTFDGSLLNGGLYEGNGGAFHLRYVQSTKLNCVIENHHVNGDGGAIYGEADVSGVEASNIKHCSATRQGGGVYGVRESTLDVSSCHSEYGAGVAYCDDCQVVARANTAVLYGGGAYKCQNLMAQGYWRSNRAEASVGHHIYSAGGDISHDDHTHQDYWWHALYLDGPVMCGTQPWRNDHF
ncbi:hypothetical protein [Pseudoalteromonas fuliginea]|uniref:Polymer-forming cytoskeletal protein n=1 Tax=Pseudoalteromonas fuliginea TaxID=1872678 RepID=A0ABD3YBL9_9GAMM|nr:hypothetical protein [Pseudoalteromonas fuliginea]KDC52245.1 hypothetical protein DC53_05965 [Pseudoalteromonas fuliginea]KJZ23037.1 hypothetical protein TW82_19140 [Pseudoalteromonas fuliginea]